MKTVTVNASHTYEIFIKRGLLKDCGHIIADTVKAKTFAVITDDNVDKLYSDTVINSLSEKGFSVVKFVFPHGETSKSLYTLSRIYSFLCENHLTRSDCLIALGGGVVGDITGFASATYLRGIDYIQIPTTLLAQIDSSVGGKTAIDLPNGKNLVGAFKQPACVICDPDTLNTTGNFFLTVWRKPLNTVVSVITLYSDLSKNITLIQLRLSPMNSFSDAFLLKRKLSNMTNSTGAKE